MYYLIHPVAPEGIETPHSNVESALTYLDYLISKYDLPVAAPWIPYVLLYGDDASHRERCLRNSVYMVRRFDGVIMVGPRYSAGMQAEATVARELGKEVIDAIGTWDHFVSVVQEWL